MFFPTASLIIGRTFFPYISIEAYSDDEILIINLPFLSSMENTSSYSISFLSNNFIMSLSTSPSTLMSSLKSFTNS